MQITARVAPPRGQRAATEGRLAVMRDGDRFQLQAGPRAVRQSRRRVQTAGITAALASLGLACGQDTRERPR